MALDSTVLSLSLDKQALAKREIALRASDFEVVSVHTSTQAWFEIVMGRCGVFLTCEHIPAVVNAELIELFRRYCPDGTVMLVAEPIVSDDRPKADIYIPESNDPEGIVLALRNFGM